MRSLFSSDNPVMAAPLKFEPSDDCGNSLMNTIREEKPRGTQVAVKTLAEFCSNFNRDHPGVLECLSDILKEEKAIIAGGSVLQALTKRPGVRTSDWWGKKRSDIDVFLYCKSQAEANNVAGRIFFALAEHDEDCFVSRSTCIISIQNSIGVEYEHEVQIVLRLYGSPEEVLIGFDCDCCCCAYDGHAVWATDRCLQALRTGVNILNPLHSWPNKASYEL